MWKGGKTLETMGIQGVRENQEIWVLKSKGELLVVVQS